MSRVARPTVSLDGPWTLEILGHNLPKLTSVVQVPGPWTTQVPGYGDSHDSVRYSRRFVVEPGTRDTSFLVFNGVNHEAIVSLNGVVVGRHRGAWEPFEFDVAHVLQSGENRLTVEVRYPPRLGSAEGPGQLEISHGKQTWYGTTAGIWQSVRLEHRPTTHLQDVRVVADAGSARIRVTAQVAGPFDGAAVTVVVEHDGHEVARREVPVAGEEIDVEVAVPDAKLWGIGDPQLYQVTAHLERDGVADSQQLSTGFRTIEARDGEIYFNGHRLELRAVLDQDYHPGSSTIPASVEEWEAFLIQARDLGFNMLRVHIKRPHPSYYDIADRLGMLVWTELPSWLTWTPEGASEGADLLHRLIALDGHHPSIVIWTVINEAWGLDMASARQRAWLNDTFRAVRAATPGSLIVDNSACFPNFHLESDLDDYHIYRGIPESRREWDSILDEFASRPDWSWSPHGDAIRSGREPLVLSEFGNWGLPHVLDQYEDGHEPWWFALGADWAYGAGEGTGLEQRFHRLGLDQVFGSWDRLVTALQKAQSISNRYQTTSIRAKHSISGYVLTELSDVQWEANGLFDMNRTPKQFTAEYALCNGPRAVALRPQRYSLTTGEHIPCTVTVTPARTGQPRGPQAGEVRVTLDGTLLAVLPGDPIDWTTHDLVVTAPALPGAYTLIAELYEDDTLIARDEADLVVTSAAAEAHDWPMVATTDPALALWAGALGLETIDATMLDLSSPTPGVVWATRLFDDDAQRYARNGGRVLILAEDPEALGTGFKLLTFASLRSRSGDGDWVPRTDWLDRTGPFADIPGDTILGIAFEDILGDLVISGIPNAIRPATVASGLFNGWLQGSASTTVTTPFSQGLVTITTYRLRDTVDTVPISAPLGRAVLLAASGA
ncbi:glycoside hydrolase family 2 protein [Tessaracoccus sp. Z1128]